MRNPTLSSSRTGLTLIELVLVTAIMGLIALIGIRELQRHFDRISARDAVRSAASVIARARDEAVALHSPMSVHVDTVAATLSIQGRGARLPLAALGTTHGVALSTSRVSIAFDVRGLGYGAANLTLVARRGSAAETLTVSRLGRVRY